MKKLLFHQKPFELHSLEMLQFLVDHEEEQPVIPNTCPPHLHEWFEGVVGCDTQELNHLGRTTTACIDTSTTPDDSTVSESDLTCSTTTTRTTTTTTRTPSMTLADDFYSDNDKDDDDSLSLDSQFSFLTLVELYARKEFVQLVGA